MIKMRPQSYKAIEIGAPEKTRIEDKAEKKEE